MDRVRSIQQQLEGACFDRPDPTSARIDWPTIAQVNGPMLLERFDPLSTWPKNGSEPPTAQQSTR
jgi:hypothetical protein